MLFSFLGSISSCSKSSSCGKTNVSKDGGNESHNNGRNCMDCHHDGGGGYGCFNIAGSAFTAAGDGVSGGTVRLYSEPNGQGTLLATLSIDKLGNFYTTNAFSVGNGFYPMIENSIGHKVYMPSPATSGSCNSCHGVSTSRIQIQ